MIHSVLLLLLCSQGLVLLLRQMVVAIGVCYGFGTVGVAVPPCVALGSTDVLLELSPVGGPLGGWQAGFLDLTDEAITSTLTLDELGELHVLVNPLLEAVPHVVLKLGQSLNAVHQSVDVRGLERVLGRGFYYLLER